MNQAELVAVLADLCAQQRRFDPEVRTWVRDHLSYFEILDLWQYDKAAETYARPQLGGPGVAWVDHCVDGWSWSVKAGPEPQQGMEAEAHLAMARADEVLSELGYLTLGVVVGA